MISKVLFLGYLFVCSLEDIRRKKVYVGVLLAGAVVAVAAGYLNPGVSLVDHVFGVGMGLVMLLLSVISREAIGFADSIMCIYLGIVTGFERGVVILMMALMLCAICSGGLLCFHVVSRKQRMPFLPFLWIAAIGSIFLFGGRV